MDCGAVSLRTSDVSERRRAFAPAQLTPFGSGAREPDRRAHARLGLPSQAEECSALLPIYSLSRPRAPSRPPPLVGLAYRAMSKE
ncbi:hypothetical protein EV363DRAFT_1397457 [Boletus edulis]|nr:hypothetical protein EV363DRAFT_1397457 [Boletus edulis]